MRPIRERQIGERFVLPKLTCTRRSHYERLIHGEQSRVFWRYEFWTDSGERVVYTGGWLHGVEPQSECYLRATIKKQEPQWGQTRLSRPVVLEPEKMSLDFG